MENLDEITTDKGTFRVRLECDDDACNPREDYDQATTMVLAHRYVAVSLRAGVHRQTWTWGSDHGIR